MPNLQSPEITGLIDPEGVDVLHYHRERGRYEIRPSLPVLPRLLAAGFSLDRRRGLYFSMKPIAVRRVLEWELLADPDTYARLKCSEGR